MATAVAAIRVPARDRFHERLSMATGVGIITAFVLRIRTMPQTLAAAALAGLIYLLGGCGQTGPLYLPEEAPAQTEQPADAGTPADGSP